MDKWGVSGVRWRYILGGWCRVYIFIGECGWLWVDGAYFG